MEKESRENKFSVSDFIDDNAANDDSEAESGEAGAADGSQLHAGEVELLCPVCEDASTDAETNSGGENGGESSP